MLPPDPGVFSDSLSLHVSTMNNTTTLKIPAELVHDKLMRFSFISNTQNIVLM